MSILGDDRASYGSVFSLNGVNVDLKNRLMSALLQSPLNDMLYPLLLEILAKR